jgi:cell fate regulator YaaT (PSP1 superfamily)
VETMTEIIGVQFKDKGKSYYFDANGLQIEKNQLVIVENAQGLDCGKCVAPNHPLPEDFDRPLKKVVRVATADDEKRLEENRAKEEKAFGICLEKINNRKLEMKLVSVEYTFDGSKILFYFTADGRVDFRELVKDLAAVFRTRIELRQVGVRDEAKMLGGLGICGREFCCSRFLNEFQPVTIKMAKEQNLSLNPVKISGTCGRLMCCLGYEEEAYEHLNRITPRFGTPVKTPQGKGVVQEANILTGKIKVKMDNAPDMLPEVFDRKDVKPLERKRNDHHGHGQDSDQNKQ